MTACCMKAGCNKTWPRDPCLEVECPTCGAKIGERCRRPSGHPMRPGFHGFGFHDARDIAAYRAGHYGPCPLGCCGLDEEAELEADGSVELRLL